MALAKGLKRTLVLPPWVEYAPGQRKPRMVPWETFFQVLFKYEQLALRQKAFYTAHLTICEDFLSFRGI